MPFKMAQLKNLPALIEIPGISRQAAKSWWNETNSNPLSCNAAARSRDGFIEETKSRGLRAMLICSFIFCLGNGICAAEIPKKYRGVWSNRDCELPKSESEVGESPYLVVSAQGTKAHEESCSIREISRITDGTGDSITFSCTGEAEEWDKKETWSISERALKIHGITIKEIYLIIRDGDSATWRKCAVSTKEKHK